MIRHDRQGWRLLIVLSRLAVAGLLTVSGPPGLMRPGPVLAQTDTTQSPHPPPRPGLPAPPPTNTPPPELPAASANPGRPPDPPTKVADTAQPTPAAFFTPEFDSPPRIVLPIPPSLEQLTAQRNSLNQFLHRDRRHHLLLTRGDRALSGGDVNVALLHFQALVDASHDAFYWPDNSLEPRGARSSAQTRLQSLPLDLRQTYQRVHGDEARALLNEAIENEDRRRLGDVLRRFRLTDAGRDAMIRELLFAHDRGHLTRAAELARLLADDPYHWRRLSPRLQTLVSRMDDGLDSRPCASPTGSASTCRPISPPALRPLWTRSLSEGLECLATADPEESHVGVDRFVEDAINRWLIEHDDRRLPVATANQATVVDEVLLIRDFSGIRALELRTGRPVWSYRGAGSLARAAVKSLQEEARGGGAPPLSFHAHFAGQGPSGRLTTDGRRVFLIDCHEHAPARDSAETDPAPPDASNRLVALSLDGPERSHHTTDVAVPRTAWVRGASAGGEADSLRGHFFLGPPHPLDGRLFVLTERDRQLHCVALGAAGGELLWQQPIALVEQPIDWDSARLEMACSPVSAGSVVVCPTEVGVVVGVDSLTGTLRWIYDHIDDDQRLAAGRWSSTAQRNHGGTELPSRMLVQQGRIFHLPFRSRFVHCIDAATGVLLWKVERRGALGLSAATPEKVILIGTRDVIALSTADGSLEWETTSPEPAGHGLIAGGHYLLPTCGGRCLSFSLSDGALTGSRFGRLLHELSQPPAESPSAATAEIQLAGYDGADGLRTASISTPGGNLLAAEDVVVVATPTGVAVFPQARPQLQSLTAAAGNGDFAAAQGLEAAMLHLLLGEQAAAGHRLRSLLETPASAPIHHAATRLLREILFTELAATADPRPILDQLATMSGDGPDRARFLVSRIDAELKLGKPARLIEAIGLFRGLNRPSRVNPDGEADFLVQASAHVADRLSVARSRGDGGVRAALEAYVSRTAAEAATSGDVGERERLLTLFDAWPQIAEVRNDVAEACLDAGQLQRAELLLLQNRQSQNRAAAARARRLLTDIYATQGLQREAATNLAELAADFREDPVGEGLTGREFVDQFPHDHPAWQIVRRRRAAPLPPYNVRISEHICDDECAAAGGCRSVAALKQHDRIRRKFFIGDDSSLAIIDRGIVPGDRNHSRLTLVNRETGGLHAELRFPAPYWQLAGGSTRRCGQLLPICGRTAHGLSLLEQRPIWSMPTADAGHPRDKVKLGPLGAGFCVLQTPRRLSVIDPGTGETLWERGNLPPDVGLLTNEATGIIGDAETLTLFGADQRSYTVYRMKSGRKERHGRLNVSAADARRHRQAIGAKLVHVVAEDTRALLRIWDAAADRVLFEEPLRERLFCPIGHGTQYALIRTDGRLLIVDVATGRVDLDVPLADEHLQHVSDLSVAADRDHYFVNLVGCPHESAAETVAATDEVELPNIRVQGRLMVISRAGRLLWQQSVADAVMLTHSNCSLPVLTLLSRVRDAQNRQTSRLRIDVLDARSGEPLARRDDLQRTRIVQSTYDHRLGQLTLIGLNSRIDVDFGPRRREFLIHAEVDETDGSLVR